MDKLDKPGLMNRSANVYLSNLIDKVNELIDKVNELESKHEQANTSKSEGVVRAPTKRKAPKKEG